MIRRQLIIGYGNPLRGDDAMGRLVATQLQALGSQGSRTIRVEHQLVPELAEEIAQYDTVVFVDACAEHLPGTVRLRELRLPRDIGHPSYAEPGARAAFTHHVGPRELLTMAEILYGHVPRAFLMTLGGYDFGYREDVTAQARELVGEAVKMLSALLYLDAEGKLPFVAAA